jgi:protein-tyrosine phosphatase
MARSPLARFGRIDDHLAVGSAPTDADLAWLAAQGLDGLLCLQSDADLEAHDTTWAARLAACAAVGIEAARVPIVDFEPDDLLRNLDEAVRALRRLHHAGRSVYVHCNAGLNRSPSVVIAGLMDQRDWPLKKAWTFVSKRHTCAPYESVMVAWATRHRLALR